MLCSVCTVIELYVVVLCMYYQGVIELYVVEAHELLQADTNMFRKSTSDPYCIVTGTAMCYLLVESPYVSVISVSQ